LPGLIGQVIDPDLCRCSVCDGSDLRCRGPHRIESLHLIWMSFDGVRDHGTVIASCRRICLRGIRRRADRALTFGGGEPLDRDDGAYRPPAPARSLDEILKQAQDQQRTDAEENATCNEGKRGAVHQSSVSMVALLAVVTILVSSANVNAGRSRRTKLACRKPSANHVKFAITR